MQLNLRNLVLSIHFRFKLCTTLYTLLSAVQHCHFQRLFIFTKSHCSVLKIKKSLTNAVKLIVTISQLKQEVWNSYRCRIDSGFAYHLQIK